MITRKAPPEDAPKRKTTKKKTAPPEEKPADEHPTPKTTKTRLKEEELLEFKKLLLLKRAEICGDLTSIEKEALRLENDAHSAMPIHMADVGSETYEQDFMLGLAETERQQLREIDEALQRIADGTYGVCQMTGKQIPKARLRAKPWAKYTIEAARKVESGWSE